MPKYIALNDDSYGEKYAIGNSIEDAITKLAYETGKTVEVDQINNGGIIVYAIQDPLKLEAKLQITESVKIKQRKSNAS